MNYLRLIRLVMLPNTSSDVTYYPSTPVAEGIGWIVAFGDDPPKGYSSLPITLIHPLHPSVGSKIHVVTEGDAMHQKPSVAGRRLDHRLRRRST